ncbi:MAG: thioredoxin family protein [Gammaproteobacteria bacterium]
MPKATASSRRLLSAIALLIVAGTVAIRLGADEELEPLFDDEPQLREVKYPDWFKSSFLDLRADVREAVATGKRGLIVYFGQAHCAYCEALFEINFNDPEIVAYTQEHFDVVPIDIGGKQIVITPTGKVMTEEVLALEEQTNFTPTVLFYDSDGDEVFRLRGYYPPFTFRAALEYVADRHYHSERFRDYLARGEAAMIFEGELADQDFVSPAPYALDRTRFPAEQPLLVLFEQGDCHGCNVLHAHIFSDPVIRQRLESFEIVQLDMWADTPVLTPEGRHTSARDWAADLELFYAPSLVFFDERGQEIMRIDSVVRLYRLTRVLDYLISGAYKEHPHFPRWHHRDAYRATPWRLTTPSAP